MLEVQNLESTIPAADEQLHAPAPVAVQNASHPSRLGRILAAMGAKFREILGIDFRTLAIGRIALGSVGLADLLMRSRDMRAHYTDFGILPRAAHLEKTAGAFDFSLHMAAGAQYGQWLLFAFNAVILVAMIVGVRTTLSTITAWLMLISMQNRNPMILHAGDVELRCLMFFAMFLPLGARWSVDALRRGPRDGLAHGNHLSPATVAILLQVALIYTTSALHKTGAEWRVDHTAVFLALNLDQFATPLGIWVRQFREQLEYLTIAVVQWEMYGPVLFFLPFFNLGFRTFAMLAFIFMHMSFELLLGLGIFPFFSAAGLVFFTHGGVIDRISSYLKPQSQTLANATPSGVKTNVNPIHFANVGFKHRLGMVAQIIPLAALILVLVWNYQNLPNRKNLIGSSKEWVMRIPRLDQKWDMFAPKPLVEDGWYVIDGQLDDGKKVDVYNRKYEPVTWEKPPYVAGQYPNERWQKYLMNLWSKKHRHQWLYYGKYVCRDWNEEKFGAERLKTFEIYFMLERSNAKLPSGKEPPEKVSLWRHNCY